MNGSIGYLALQAGRPGQASRTHVDEIVAGLRDRGWTVHLEEPGYGDRGRFSGLVRRALGMLAAQLRLARRVSDLDVLYVRFHPFAVPAVWWARRHERPVVQEVNGTTADIVAYHPGLRPLAPVLDRLSRWLLTRADHVIAVTDDLARWVAGHAPRSRRTVLPNAANTRVFSPDGRVRPGPRDRRVAFVGELAPWQGLATIVAASRNPDWPDDVELVVAGDGPLRPLVESAADGRRITYVGTLPQTEVAALLRGSLASLSMKTTEARHHSPLKVYESLACATPVVVSDVGEQAELIRRGGCGAVVAAGDPAALARAVTELASDPEGARHMGRSGHDLVVEHHTWDQRAGVTAGLLEEVAGSRARRG